MRLQAICYRAVHPDFEPLSGEGGALYGGRFNPIGVPAFYFGLTIDALIAELTQGFPHRFNPLMIVTCDVDVAGVVDLRTDDGRAGAGVALADMACAWKQDQASGREPASWLIADRLRRTAAGILVPSFARGTRPDMHNLVLWAWGAPNRVVVHDPDGRLSRRGRGSPW